MTYNFHGLEYHLEKLLCSRAPGVSVLGPCGCTNYWECDLYRDKLTLSNTFLNDTQDLITFNLLLLILLFF